LDARLSEAGIRQCVDVRADQLRDVNPQLIVVSPFTRTLQTAHVLFGGIGGGVPFLVHDLCRERSGKSIWFTLTEGRGSRETERMNCSGEATKSPCGADGCSYSCLVAGKNSGHPSSSHERQAETSPPTASPATRPLFEGDGDDHGGNHNSDSLMDIPRPLRCRIFLMLTSGTGDLPPSR